MLCSIITLTLIGCTQVNPDDNVSKKENYISNDDIHEIDAELPGEVYNTLDELLQNAVESIRSNESSPDVIYVPDSSAFKDYNFISCEILNDRLTYYYMPKKSDMTSYISGIGIRVTHYLNNSVTVDSYSKQVKLEADSEGYIYDEKRGMISFTKDDEFFTVYLPDSLTTKDSAKAFCKVEAIK